jgi:hypothetical protein
MGTVLHPGPLVALAIIAYVGWWTTAMSLRMHPGEVPLGFVSLVAVILGCFFSAMYAGAGLVPRGWTEPLKDDCSKLQFCKECNECVGSHVAPIRRVLVAG